MWNLVFVSLETVVVSVQDRCTVCVKHTIGSEKSFWTRPMVLLGDEAQVEARFITFSDSAILTLDRCTICAECTIGSEIILDTPDETPR
jgi:hypothetical protein